MYAVKKKLVYITCVSRQAVADKLVNSIFTRTSVDARIGSTLVDIGQTSETE